MLKRKIFVKHENESNEQYETRINTFFQENDKFCKFEDHIGHNIHGSSNGKFVALLIYHESKENPQKTKIGF